MLITVIHLYDNGLVEHYVGAVTGKLTAEQKVQICRDFKAEGIPDDDEDGRSMSFVEIEVTDAVPYTLVNIEGEED